MKECNYSANKYWLCPNSLAKSNDSWLNSGHPCKFSSHNLLNGSIECVKQVKDSVSDTSLYYPIDQQLKHA